MGDRPGTGRATTPETQYPIAEHRQVAVRPEARVWLRSTLDDLPPPAGPKPLWVEEKPGFRTFCKYLSIAKIDDPKLDDRFVFWRLHVHSISDIRHLLRCLEFTQADKVAINQLLVKCKARLEDRMRRGSLGMVVESSGGSSFTGYYLSKLFHRNGIISAAFAVQLLGIQ